MLVSKTQEILNYVGFVKIRSIQDGLSGFMKHLVSYETFEIKITTEDGQIGIINTTI